MTALLISSISYADNPLQSQGRIEYGEGANKVVFDASDLESLEARIANIEATVNGTDGSGSLQSQIDAVSNNLANYKTDVASTYATQTWVTGKGYLTRHQSLADYATKTYVDNKVAGISTGGGGGGAVTFLLQQAPVVEGDNNYDPGATQVYYMTINGQTYETGTAYSFAVGTPITVSYGGWIKGTHGYDGYSFPSGSTLQTTVQEGKTRLCLKVRVVDNVDAQYTMAYTSLVWQ